jgi:hypothetical protein
VLDDTLEDRLVVVLPEGLLDSDDSMLPEMVVEGLALTDDTTDCVTMGVSVLRGVTVRVVDIECVIDVVTDADELSVGIVELERLEETDIDTVEVIEP